jgi:hypothetical protein
MASLRTQIHHAALSLMSLTEIGRSSFTFEAVCTENPIRVDDVTESLKLAE